jgi:hypothetical protein
MGANPTQALGVVLFFTGFTAMAAGLAMDTSFLLLIAGLALMAVAVVLFLRCKPWEYREQ